VQVNISSVVNRGVLEGLRGIDAVVKVEVCPGAFSRTKLVRASYPYLPVPFLAQLLPTASDLGE